MRSPAEPTLADQPPDPLGRIVAAWTHEADPADVVRELKYGRATSVVTRLADAMAAVAPAADLITWVPASPARRRRRGFDQGELLARAVARRLGLGVRKTLRRTDDVPQTARELEGRLVGPRFAGAGRRLWFAPTVLVVDDVCTTGTTLRAAARVLVSRGAGRVDGLVATRAVVADRPARPAGGVYDLSTTRTSGG